MVLTRQRDLIRMVADRWHKTYHPYATDFPTIVARNRDGSLLTKTKRQIASELESLNKETALPRDVDEIIGNSSWTRMECNECGLSVDALLRVGQEPDYESHTAELCLDCVRKAYQFIEASK